MHSPSPLRRATLFPIVAALACFATTVAGPTPLASAADTTVTPGPQDTSPPAGETPLAQALERDRAHCGALDSDVAIRGCTALIQSGSDSGAALVRDFQRRGRAYRRENQYQRAIQDFDEATHLEPDLSQAFSDRGETYAAIAGEYSIRAHGEQETDRLLRRAIDDYDTAIRLDPKNAGAFQRRGLAFREHRQEEQHLADSNAAIRLASEWIRRDPRDAAAYYTRGKAYFDKLDVPRAIDDLDQAVQLDPQNPDALFSLGRAEVMTAFLHDLHGSAADQQIYGSRIQQAPQRFEAALRIDPHFAEALKQRALRRMFEQDYKGAVEDFDEVLRLNPQDADAFLRRAGAKQQIGDAEGARADMAQALKLDLRVVGEN